MRASAVIRSVSGLLLAATMYLVCGAQGGKSMSLKLTIRSFENGGTIPKEFTCDGADMSPALEWTGAPTGTKTFALIADDPDAPAGTWVHWVLWNLPPGTKLLPDAVPTKAELEGGAKQGQNDFKKTGYRGPCPPPGTPHRYFFKLYALDAALKLPAGATKSDLERTMNGHILEQSEWMGRYSR